MSTEQTVYQGPVTKESLQRIPAFVTKQMQAYRGSDRKQAVVKLQVQEITFHDKFFVYEAPEFPTEDYYSFLPRGSQYWLEQNPSFISPRQVDMSIPTSTEWANIDVWVIHWDTSEDDTVDNFEVTGIRFTEVER